MSRKDDESNQSRPTRSIGAACARTRPIRNLIAVAAALMVGLCALPGAAFAADGADALSARYRALRAPLDASPLGLPIVVESLEDGGQIRGEVHAVLQQPFAPLMARLKTPRDWCQVVLLHLNVKTCTHEGGATGDWLTFYSGRKFYEPLEKAYPLRFSFHAPAADAKYMKVTLTAESGPFSTRDYRILFEAIPLPQGTSQGTQSGTFVHFVYSYRTSLVSRIATKGYLETIGRDKVGFTTTGQGDDGKPQYVGGSRGVAERNAVRYYFAIQAFLEDPAEGHVENRLERWFQLTERYPAQLHELDKADYLQFKRQEFQQQVERQKAIDGGTATSRTQPSQ